MALNYAYHYAEVDDATGLCIGVMTSSDSTLAGPTSEGTTYYEIPVYDPDYMFKYYLNGAWYEDEEGTIPWTSPMM